MISEADLIAMQERMRRNGAPEPSPGVTAQLAGAETADELEAPIQAECTKILEADGWRALQTDPVRSRIRGKGFGEIGMADHLYIRYGSRPYAQVLWIEYKRSKGGRVSKEQRAWHTREHARGARTAIAGEDFAPTVEGFRTWYTASRLQRRDVP